MSKFSFSFPKPRGTTGNAQMRPQNPSTSIFGGGKRLFGGNNGNSGSNALNGDFFSRKKKPQFGFSAPSMKKSENKKISFLSNNSAKRNMGIGKKPTFMKTPPSQKFPMFNNDQRVREAPRSPKVVAKTNDVEKDKDGDVVFKDKESSQSEIVNKIPTQGNAPVVHGPNTNPPVISSQNQSRILQNPVGVALKKNDGDTVMQDKVPRKPHTRRRLIAPQKPSLIRVNRRDGVGVQIRRNSGNSCNFQKPKRPQPMVVRPQPAMEQSPPNVQIVVDENDEVINQKLEREKKELDKIERDVDTKVDSGPKMLLEVDKVNSDMDSFEDQLKAIRVELQIQDEQPYDTVEC